MERLENQRIEIERLREIEAAARTYYRRYCQDEATDREICISDMQHEDAQRLRDALGEPTPPPPPPR